MITVDKNLHGDYCSHGKDLRDADVSQTHIDTTHIDTTDVMSSNGNGSIFDDFIS